MTEQILPFNSSLY